MKAGLVLLTGVAALATTLVAVPTSAAGLPPSFVIENATPSTGFNNPTALAFTPDGRILVAEKRGVVRVVRNGVKLPQPMWDGQAEVLNNGDRGLLSVAVDPHYTANHFIYLLYAVDPDSDGVDGNDVAFGRVTRYRTAANDSNVVDPASRKVLIGARWSDGIPSGSESHSVGALRWGQDGSLLVSAGDGAQFTQADSGGMNPALFGAGRIDSSQDIGAFRAQYTASLSGKILRVNPADGTGYESNPFFDGDPRSAHSRVWAYGFRNPFRFCVRPGSGDSDPEAGSPGVLCVGDVGWNAWEELDVTAGGGNNFGWPCYEGNAAVRSYQAAQSNHRGCESVGSPDNPSTPLGPAMVWSHSDSTLSSPIGLRGNCVVAGVFYTGHSYPEPYRNRLFFADFGRSWIKVAALDTANRVIQVDDFASSAQGPVDFAVDPVSGDVHYISIYTGTLFRIRYTGDLQGDQPPAPVAAATPTAGVVPLAVAFSSAGTSDPDADLLSLSWNFGDGSGSTDPAPQHVYENPGEYAAVLTVSDGRGGLSRDTVVVVARSVFAFPITKTLDDFHRTDGSLGKAWVGGTSGLLISGNELIQVTTPSYAILDSVILGPDQEAFVTFAATTDSSEQSLMLKVQGRSWLDGHVRVDYDTRVGGVIVLTYTPSNGWKRVGGPFAVRFGAGDRLGARAYANGVVEAYKNGTLLGSASVGDWPFAASGGRVGLALVGATTARIDEIGGGNLAIDSNTPPHATITLPAERVFYAAGDTLRLAGTGIDAQEPSDSLHYHWEVDLHHNNHVHPATLAGDGTAITFVAENHDDGTGVWLRARFMVTDSHGATDTTWTDLFPEIDLEPSAVSVILDAHDLSLPPSYRFTLFNHGRMPAPYSHWRLVAGSTVLAEGDTLVAPLGAVEIVVDHAPALAPGVYDLRLTADTLGTVVEVNEANNARTNRLTVAAGGGVLAAATQVPASLSLSGSFPNPSAGRVGLRLDLPRPARVEFAVFDIQGREVWTQAPGAYSAGRWTLEWSGRSAGGERTSAGIYLARVTVEDRTFTRRLVRLR